MNEEVASLYATIGLKISGATRGLRDFRSRLMSAQSSLKTLRDQSKITATAINVGLTAGLVALGLKGVTALADAGVSMAVFKLATNATTEEMERARAKIVELARDASLPKATLAESSSALSELGKAGMSARDSIDALRPTMLLAAAGELAAKDAALILSAALLTFHLPGTEAARVANLLAGAELRAAGSVKDHADAMRQAGGVFAMAKVPIEDLVTSIALLANEGLKGQDAGTALKTMMLSLTAPSTEAAAMMRSLGVSVFDAQGKMRPLRDIFDDFRRGLGPLTDAQKMQRLETIFGTDAIRAAGPLIAGGSEAFDKMKAAITETGLAQELATAKTAGLGGAIDGLGKAIDTASVGAAKPFEEDIKTIARALANTILWLDSFDDTTKKWVVGIFGAILAVGGLAIVVGGVSSVLGTVITFMISAWGWIGWLAVGVRVLAGALTFLAMNPISLVIIAIAGLVALLIWAYQNSEDFRNIVDGAFAGVQSAASALWAHLSPIFGKIGDALQKAIGWVGDLLRAWNLLPTSVPAPHVNAPSAPTPPQWQPPVNVGGGVQAFVGGKPVGRAGGGSVSAGSPYWVGERGPELFTPGRSGGITPNGGGAGTMVNNNFYGPVFGFSDLKDHIARAVAELKAEGRV